MAVTKSYHTQSWNTFHENGPFAARLLLSTEHASMHTIPDKLERYNDCAAEVRRLLAEALSAAEGFRAYGSAWSMNNIAHHKERMHFNAMMNIKFEIGSDDVVNGSAYQSNNLFFLECGNTIKEISGFLFNKGKSLKTSGASNGQTIAGAISTGIHGSAVDVGSVQDYVVGINLITGPGPDDVVYLERHSRPALKDSFAAKIKSRVVRNDGLFNAALVGLGSFGFIHGVLIEVEDLFLLKRYVRHISRKDALELSESQDFKNSDFRIEGETDAAGHPLKPYHFKVYLNPYNEQEDYVAEVIYKKTYTSNYPNPIDTIQQALYKDLPDFIARFASTFNRSIPLMLKAMKGTLFPKLDTEVTGTLGEIFWDSIHKGPAFAFTIGVDHSQTSKALDLFVQLARNEGPIPGAMALRFVKASEATLAFTKFPVTCIVEMDGVLWKGSKKMISIEKYSQRLIEVYQQAGIKFTIHWGKTAQWSYPGLCDYMYGNRKTEWMQYRSALLGPEVAKVFTNDFLVAAGLAQFQEGIAADLIASQSVIV